jgi:hypothetical protein
MHPFTDAFPPRYLKGVLIPFGCWQQASQMPVVLVFLSSSRDQLALFTPTDGDVIHTNRVSLH